MDIKRYGWTPDVPDQRDHLYSMARRIRLPQLIDLRIAMPPVYDQGQLGSCTANAIAANIHYERRRQNFAGDFIPSRLFVYYNERAMEGTIASDSGAMIRDGIKSVGRLGDCPETQDGTAKAAPYWPYDVASFTVKPSEACYANALKYRALDYWRVPRVLTQMKGCLAAGFPFVFGFSVYESFESDAVGRDGMVSMPQDGEQMIGGHAVLAVGYDEIMQRFICRNSWGASWGVSGYFTIPYAYLMDPNLSDDMWVIKAEAA
jgi:C1A family cysteine protease